MTSYASSFPVLHSIPIPPFMNMKRKQGLPPHSDPLAPPKCPTYLKQTAFADLIHEQYEQTIRRKRSSTEPEELLQLDLRLPTAWNSTDKAKHVTVDKQCLALKYAGPGKTEAHAASVRSNFPMRPQSGIFYYEVKIISKGDDGFIGIGFCTKENDLERLPGWDVGSFGYHGDDGHGFAGSGVGKNYGPSYTTGDTIGCGFNFCDASAFYTKNGTLVGTAFTSIDLSKVYYPVVGLRTPGEHVVANFGDEDFVFDVALYIKDQVGMIWKDLIHADKPLRQTTYEEDTTDLVLEHLLHHGYTKTAKSLLQDDQYHSGDNVYFSEIDKSCRDTKQRQDIRHAVMEGHIDEAIRLTDQHYPGTFQQKDSIIFFELSCGKFVEIMREYSYQQKRQRPSSSSMESSDTNDACWGNDIPEMRLSPSNMGQRRTSWASIAASSSSSSHSIYSSDLSDSSKPADPMEITPSTSPHSSYEPVPSIVTAPESSVDSPLLDIADTDNLLKSAMKLGQSIQEDYRSDKRPYIKERLTEIFSLLAYPDIENSPSASLLDISCRDLLATKLNSVILELQAKPITSSLEKDYQQMVVVNKQLMYQGDGKAILLKMNSLDNLGRPSLPHYAL